MTTFLLILLYIVMMLTPASGILAYYKHYDVLFYIASIISAIEWLVGIIASFAQLPVAGVIVLVVPLLLAYFLKQQDGYNMLLYAACYGAYMTYLFIYMYGSAMGRWSI